MRLLLLILAGCGPDPDALPPPPIAPTSPDVLLITVDTLRADRVGAYGDPLAQTPRMDALAQSGALFREAHAVTPLTLPSHASILTGRYPAGHGLRDNGGFRMQPDVPLLAEALAAQGYATGAFVSAYVLDSAWGLDRGFDTYRDPFHPQDIAQSAVFGEVELPGAEVVNAAAAWWRAQGGEQPRFMWVHLYDPHTPWAPHAGWEGDPYRGEVSWTDGLVGRLLDATDEGDLVVLTSDHGEGLWDHGEREHGVLLGRSITRVPLLVRPPGGTLPAAASAPGPRPPGEPVSQRPQGVDAGLVLDPVPDAPRAALVVQQPVSGVDVAPTIADYAGASLGGTDGRSLRPLLEGGDLDATPVYAETWFPWFHYGWASLHMAQDLDARVEQGRYTTRFAWSGDPAGAAPERVTLDPAHPLARTLSRFTGEGVPEPGPVPADQAAALAALGYVSTRVEPGDDVPDPRDQIGVLAALHAAEALPADRAIPALERLLSQAPQMADARLSLALKRAEAGDAAGALADTEAVLADHPDHPTALSNAAALARDLDQPDKTLAFADRMRAVNPQDPRGYRLAAAVHVDREDAPAVLDICRAGVAVAPDDPHLNYLLGLAEVQAGDPLAGVEHLRAAREHGTQATDIDLFIGAGYQRAGRIEEALAAYEAAVRSMPGDVRPWAMAGWMLYKADRCEDAQPFLVNVARRGGAGDAKVQEALRACQSRP